MAKRRVIAYFMHESERQFAEQAMTSAQVTDSFAIGDVEDAEIAQLGKQGIIVKAVPSPSAFEEASAPDSMESSTLGFGLTPSAAAAFDEAVPKPVDYYTVQLNGPLMEQWRQKLDSVGVKLLERDRIGEYKARLTAQQVAALNAFDFVMSVKWITPRRSAPRRVTQSVSPAPGAPQRRVFKC